MTNGFFVGFALAILLWFLAFLYLKGYVRRRTDPDFFLDLLQDEVRQLEAAIDYKTEQELQLLEDKINSLRVISEEAERRIVVYKRELEKHGNENQVLEALNKKPLVERLTINTAKAADAAYRVETRKPYKQTPLSNTKTKANTDITEIKEPVPPAPINITKSREPLTFKPRPIKERIAELQKAGFSPELIAKRLDINLGEVEFYFNLAKKPE